MLKIMRIPSKTAHFYLFRQKMQQNTSFLLSKFSNFSSKIKDKISNISLFKNEGEQKNEDVLAELKKITDNKERVKTLKNILSKYKNKFYADDKMKIDMLLNSLEKNV